MSKTIPEQADPSVFFNALNAAGIEYAGFSCDGVNLFGSANDIDQLKRWHHDAGTVAWLKSEIVRLRSLVEDVARTPTAMKMPGRPVVRSIDAVFIDDTNECCYVLQSALPHTGQQEGVTRALVLIAQGANNVYDDLPRDGIKPLSRYEMACIARQALLSLRDDHERDTPVVPPIGQEK